MSNKNTDVAVYFDTNGEEIEVEGQWETVVDPESANYVTWDVPNTAIVGTYLGRTEQTIKTSKTFAYELQTGPDPVLDVVGFHGTMDLDRKFAVVAPGTVVKITYLGESETGSKNTFKNFIVQAIVPKQVEAAGKSK